MTIIVLIATRIGEEKRRLDNDGRVLPIDEKSSPIQRLRATMSTAPSCSA
ncbi:hypothetical protein KZ820_17655 [Sphingomonas sp. RRHST34]|uniref:Uncharacterized protein n=1 Tax=Sphingomonas citri TaxID=2862499 RepID=A0ABS7BSM4_9SPHN|nr:hypothetical protein [Sphingomonas citri]MBW6532571.1 hypothetical protein [Sphingomonas citri]